MTAFEWDVRFFFLVKGYLCLFKGGTFILLARFFPGGTLIQGGTLIPDLRVGSFNMSKLIQSSRMIYKWNPIILFNLDP